MGRVLIRGGCVLTLGAKTPNLPEADVLIEDDRISEVGTSLRARDAEVIDAAGTIVMPGFVDTHRHVWKSLLRNTGSLTQDVDTGHHRPDDIYAATLIGLLGAAAAGVTTVVDWADLPAEPDHVEAALQAHAEAGLRTVFVRPGPGSDHSGVGSDTTIAFGSPDVRRDDVERLGADWTVARAGGLRVHAHAGRSPSEAGAVADLGRRGLLGPDVTLVHCTHLGDDDLDAVSEAGAAVALAPSSEMACGMGTPPLQKFLDRKIQPGLAVDDERIAPGDMFSQMRVANSIQHGAYFDLKLAGKAGLPNLLTTRDIIRYATIDGARAIGLDTVTGSLEPGKRADVIVLRTDRPNIYPINDPIGAVVWGVDSSNVDTVLVGGRSVMRDGVLGADVERARGLATSARDRVMAAAGLTGDSRPGDGR